MFHIALNEYVCKVFNIVYIKGVYINKVVNFF